MAKYSFINECHDYTLLNEEFLVALFEQQTRELYAQVISLDINELPLDTIEGKITGGSINVDGDSNVRRSCNLSMVSDEIDINDFYWGLKTKFKLEIGLKNNLKNEYEAVENGEYPDIVWFPCGTYLITNFNTSITTNSCNISLSGKDKMCNLNGELGGQLFASVDFGSEEYMEEILIETNTTLMDMESIMSGKYYYKVEDISTCDDTIFQNNSTYAFQLYQNIPSNYTHFYKKDGNVYRKIISGEQPSQIYELYKIVIDPVDALTDYWNCDFAQSKYNIIQSIKTENTTQWPIDFVTWCDENNIPQDMSIRRFDSVIGGWFESKKYYQDAIAHDGIYQHKIYSGNVPEAAEHYYNLFTNFPVNTIPENKLKLFYQNQGYYTTVPLYVKDFTYSIKKIPLEKIIRESVHTYAKEPYYNIIITDLNNYGLEQLTYKGDDPIYALRNYETDHFSNLIRTPSDNLVACFNTDGFVFDSLLTDSWINSHGTILEYNKNTEMWSIANTINHNSRIFSYYTIAKIEYGQDIGYRITDLTYTGDLISSIGESLTSILDKIKSMLSDFEYFYDLQGRFVFQRKKTHVNTSWSQLTNNEDESYVTFLNDPLNEKFAFNFEGNLLISAINNNPVLTNLKNDYAVWGKRKGISGADIPIHARYAIDRKPKQYQALSGILYYTEEAINDVISNEDTKLVDWRELIYQMALDYFAGQGCSSQSPIYDKTGQKVLENPDHFLYEVGCRNQYYYPTGITGYEQYYTDMQGFWRQLYNPEYTPEPIYTPGYYTEENVEQSNGFYSKQKLWHQRALTDINIEYYFDNQYVISNNENITETDRTKIENQLTKYFCEPNDNIRWPRRYWNINVFENPEALNFWFDFLDSGTELAQFAVPTVGDRIKTVNEDKAQAIIFKEIPDIILVDRDSSELTPEQQRAGLDEQTGYTSIYLPKGFSQYFTISYRNLSIKNKIDELLYQFGYCIENITITCLPIYNLQPNTRIFVYDKATNINGEYIVNKLTIPLTYNGTMQVTAVRAPERLY